MKFYLNDWSLAPGTKSLTESKAEIETFYQLLRHLSEYGMKKVIVPSSFPTITICGQSFANMFIPQTGAQADLYKRIVMLAKLFKKADSEDLISGVTFVVGEGNDKQTSDLLGSAAQKDLPSVSFMFDPNMAHTPIEGKFQGGDRDGEDAKVVNFYDKDKLDVRNHGMYLLHPVNPADRDPLKTPLWNNDVAAQYLKDFDLTKEIKAHPNEKKAILRTAGAVIARMNGWELDERVTSLNNADEHMRQIFYSAKFQRADCYLSTDFEKVDVHFELCNFRGIHQGEFKWDGNPSGEADKKHNIKV